MAKQSKKFLEILKKKLSYGSTRSILINCIPGKLASRLAINDLNIIKDGIAEDFINQLTTLSDFDFKFSIKYDSENNKLLDFAKNLNELSNSKKVKIEKRISSIKYDNDDHMKEHGVETFGFGFPIIVRRNPNDITKVIASPIFIFPLGLKQSFDKSKEWVINRSQESGIKINEALRSYLKSENHIDLPLIPDEMLDDGLLEKKEIEDFIKSLNGKLNIGQVSSFNWTKLDDIPEKIDVDNEIIGESRIILSGVFGNFKSQKQSLINDIEELIKDDNEVESKLINWEQKNSPIEVDPSQNLVLRSIAKNNKIVIQGPPGTGKSQTLTAIITAALANKMKVLVVCEKVTALKVIYDNIVKKYPNLRYSIALIEDVTSDRGKLVKIVRERDDNQAFNFSNSDIITSNISSDLEYFENITSGIDKNYKKLRDHIHEDKRWIDCVAKWISYKVEKSNIPYYDKISKTIVFDYENVSNNKIEAQIFNANEIYKNAVNLISRFDQFINTDNSDIAVEKYIEIIKNAEFELRFCLNEIKAISEKFERAINVENEGIINNILIKAENIILIKDELSAIISNPDNISFVENVKILFNRNKKIIKGQINLYKELKDEVLTFEPIQHLKFNENNFKELKIELNNKKEFLVDLINSESHSSIIDNSKYLNISESTELIEVIKKASKAFESLNLVTKRQVVELTNSQSPTLLVRSINKTLENLSRFSENEININLYLKWKLTYKGSSTEFFNIYKLLIQLGSSDWLRDYQVALLYKILYENFQLNEYPSNSNDINTIEGLMVSISNKQVEIIKKNIKNWYFRGIKKIEDKGLTLKKLYNLKGAAGTTRNSLRKIVTYDPESFTDIYPLILSNPNSTSTLFPMKQGFFDIVIFDEASQLRIEETYSSVYRGKTVIISGDSQQMPPSSYFESGKNLIDESDTNQDDSENSESLIDDSSLDMATKESLLDWAIDEGYQETYLDMHYRSKHPDLIEFSNTCFYNSRLVPMPSEIHDTPIIFKQVNGLYEKRVNESEAKEVLNIIKTNIPLNKSVGIATFNLTQRNLILDLINKERSEDKDFNSRMSTFEENGFFVKNLENIQGDERDIIILSTTFGKRSDGKFIMNFGPITQRNGHRLLNVIITRAKEKIIVLTSIPEDRQNEFRTFIDGELKVTGKSGLLAYLTYAKAVSNQNDKEKEEILSYIRQKINQTRTANNSNIGLTESPFEEEVYQVLVAEFGVEKVIPQMKCGGFRIDLVVKSPITGKNIAIECDGAAYHSSELNWHHDIYRQRQLEKQGFVFHRIWSTNWFKNMDYECQNLISFIKGK
jgi:superfamily I DNA and/or RNA helicase/very-short-patch-repair endonuclease